MKKFENYCSALENLKEILYSNGFQEAQTGSPRQILKTAFQAGMIKDEQIWLDALTSRNNVAHAYNKDIANDIVKQAKSKYYQMFCEFKLEVEENWQ